MLIPVQLCRIFALSADGYDTLEFFDQSVHESEDNGLLSWLTGAVSLQNTRQSQDSLCSSAASPNGGVDLAHASILFTELYVSSHSFAAPSTFATHVDIAFEALSLGWLWLYGARQQKRRQGPLDVDRSQAT